MRDNDKIKEQVINGSTEVPQQGAELEKLEAERKKVEDMLLKSEEKYRTLVENTTDFIFMIDERSRIVSLNRSAAKLLGGESEEIIGKSIFDLFPKELAIKYSESLKNVFKTAEPDFYESKLIAGEKKLWVDTSLSPVKDNNGKTIAVIGVSKDITERKKAEEKIKLFSDAIAGAFDCFMLTDNKGNITYVNEAACNTFGYTRDEFLRLNITELDANPEFAKKATQEIMAKGKWSGEVKNIRKNGENFLSLLSAFIIKDDEGNPKGTMGIFRDITEHKKAEEQLREQKLSLEQKNIALGEILEQVHIEKNKIKDDIAANVRESVLPVLEKLKKKKESKKYAELLCDHMESIASSYGREITKKSYNLTPRELEICNMVKGGLTSKEIADLIHLSRLTIEKHRRNIRKKLRISGKKSNLTSFLKTS